MTTDTERLAEARACIEELQAAVWDAHYGKGIAIRYVQAVDEKARAFLAHDDTPAPTGRGYIPTDVYTALPQKAKDYIMELETRCDPAGDIAELANRRDQVKQLEILVDTARSTLQVVMDAIAWSGWSIDDPKWRVPMRAARAFLNRKGSNTPAPIDTGEEG